MFNKLKDMKGLMDKAKKMKQEMEAVQKELKNLTFSAESKSGQIKITLTGEIECTQLEIAPELFTPENKEAVTKTLIQLFNKTAKEAKDSATKKLSSISAGLNIPGLT